MMNIRDFRRKSSLWIFVGLIVVSFTGLFWGGTKSLSMDFDQILIFPNKSFWMGTDSLGRDYFWRVLRGSAFSFIVGTISSMLSLVFGFIFATLMIELGEWGSRLGLRVLDIWMSIPQFIWIALVSTQLFYRLRESLDFFAISNSWISLGTLTTGIVFANWAMTTRLIHGYLQDEFAKNYVVSARALGASRWRIYRFHVLPNLQSALIMVVLTLLPSCLLYEGVMSFLGFGIHPPQASLGTLIQEGWRSLSEHPHLILFPSSMLFIFVWSLNGLKK